MGEVSFCVETEQGVTITLFITTNLCYYASQLLQNCSKIPSSDQWEQYDSAFLLLNAAAKPCPCDITLHAVAFQWGER